MKRKFPASSPPTLLGHIHTPEDLRKLSKTDLPRVADELRAFIIEAVSTQGGHFGASLGVVELTVALHFVFNTPFDRLVWDVGHQAYGHKILTGRRDLFHTNRSHGGLSGFPKRAESEYDAFGVGHASTSISAGLGMSIAARTKNELDRQVVVVIGDGALGGGMAFEALNHAGSTNANILVIVNDNGMSIDPNVGALKEYLTKISASHTFNALRSETSNILRKLSQYGPNVEGLALQLERSIKGTLFRQSNFFESLNFRYFGPIDGHDVLGLEQVLRDLRDIPGPKILHCITKKGKGYKFSEEGDSTVWHSPGLFDKKTGEIRKASSAMPAPPKYQEVFGSTLLELAKHNERIMAVTPAMLSGSSLGDMMRAMPDRTFDVGIAEQHAVTFSAGLASEGYIPFCNIYSTFMQRAYDQVIHDIALQNLRVVLCLDRAGLVGTDGATHHGAYDIAFFRAIPNMIVSAPMDEVDLRNLMYTAQSDRIGGPFALRYPRGAGTIIDWQKPFEYIEVGTGRRLREGKDIAILSLGTVGNMVANAAAALSREGIEAAHYDLRFAKPLDERMLHEVFARFSYVITIEDGSIVGGVGSGILEFMAEHEYHATVVRLGIPDRFIEHGSVDELQSECGYDLDSFLVAARSLARAAKTAKEQRKTSPE